MSPTSDILDIFPVRPDLILNSRYTVLRKLGAGACSSTWLVFDTQAEAGFKYLAAKTLTADATRRHREGEMRELEFLKAIQAREDINSLPVLRDHFELQGPWSAHLCFIMDLLSTDVSTFRRSAPRRALPPHIVKNIVAQVLEALVQLHALNIVHTDVKCDNILFNAVGDDKKVERLLAAEPLVVEGDLEIYGKRYPILRSQPLPHNFPWDAPPHLAELILVTLGQPTVNQFSAFSLRAPEIILQSDFGPKIDILALGCITFELLFGRWLFHPEAGQDWSVEDDHLAKMMELTGETFGTAVLKRGQLSNQYFDDNGKLRRIDDLTPVSLEAAMENYRVLPSEEVGPAAAFIRTCLRFDVADRASAAELELHPWLKGAFAC